MFAACEHADRKALVFERRGRDRRTVAGDVGAHTEDPAPVRFGDDRLVDVRIVGCGDGIPRAVEVAVAEFAQLQRDAVHRLDGRCRGAGDDVHVGSVGEQERKSALCDGAPTDDDDPSAVQAQADEVGVLTHRASLDVAAAAATKRDAASEWAAAWTWR